jgi:hypothetical protein
MMEAANTSETSANFYQITRRNKTEDSLFLTPNWPLGTKEKTKLCAERIFSHPNYNQ